MKNEKVAIERIALAKKNRSSSLDLSGLGLTNIPVDLSDMIYLRDINLSNNKLIVFPDDIKYLHNLYYLDISHNYLRDV